MLRLLHRLTARVSFPILEPLALGVLLMPRRRWAAVVLGMLMLLWVPRYFIPVEEYEVSGDVEGLCLHLIG